MCTAADVEAQLAPVSSQQNFLLIMHNTQHIPFCLCLPVSATAVSDRAASCSVMLMPACCASQAIKKEAGGSLMDSVIHDGAPNVGGAWASEAYSQSWLVLEALKLACEFLAPRGTFVTKIFRLLAHTHTMLSLLQTGRVCLHLTSARHPFAAVALLHVEPKQIAPSSFPAVPWLFSRDTTTARIPIPLKTAFLDLHTARHSDETSAERKSVTTSHYCFVTAPTGVPIVPIRML